MERVTTLARETNDKTVNFYVKESQIQEKGCFAKRTIHAGELITRLCGEEITGEEVNERVSSGVLPPGNDLQIDDDLFMHLDEYSTCFNHSCSPNSAVRGSVDLVTIRDITPGEEITYDYSTTIGLTESSNLLPDGSQWSMDCKCGSENCRKIITDVSSITPETLRRYLTLNALPDFIKRHLIIFDILVASR